MSHVFHVKVWGMSFVTTTWELNFLNMQHLICTRVCTICMQSICGRCICLLIYIIFMLFIWACVFMHWCNPFMQSLCDTSKDVFEIVDDNQLEWWFGMFHYTCLIMVSMPWRVLYKKNSLWTNKLCVNVQSHCWWWRCVPWHCHFWHVVSSLMLHHSLPPMYTFSCA